MTAANDQKNQAPKRQGRSAMASQTGKQCGARREPTRPSTPPDCEPCAGIAEDFASRFDPWRLRGEVSPAPPRGPSLNGQFSTAFAGRAALLRA